MIFTESAALSMAGAPDSTALGLDFRLLAVCRAAEGVRRVAAPEVLVRTGETVVTGLDKFSLGHRQRPKWAVMPCTADTDFPAIDLAGAATASRS